MLTATRIIALGALLMALGVACGAFGAHALRGRLDSYLLSVWEKAVFYHLLHAAALITVGLLAHLQLLSGSTGSRLALLFFAGIVLFAGSLYLLSLSGERWLGAITPFGGTAFIVGWIMLAVAVASGR